MRFEALAATSKSYMQLMNDLRPKKGGISSLRKIESIRLCLTDEAY